MTRPFSAQCCLLILIFAIGTCSVSAIIAPRPGTESTYGKWSGSSSSGSRRDRGKHAPGVHPAPGFSGGQALNNNDVKWCSNPDLPACQSCADGVTCTACWNQYPDAAGSRFVLSTFSGQCDCPAGYGMLPTMPPPTWPGRHLLSTLPALDVSPAAWEPTKASNESSAPGTLSAALAAAEGLLARPSDSQSVPATLAAVNYTKSYVLQDAKPGLWLPDPLPVWASLCLPCPVNYYSAGGQQGFAECKPCPGDFTTAGATAAATCLFPYCGPGQEPSRRSGRCRACPIGTYSSATANNQPCYPCPKGTTTAASGSKTYTECRVPICNPGQELDIDLLVCRDCRSNSISVGGKISQGVLQPRCRECPFGTPANGAATACQQGACPYPDDFSITCRTTNLRNATNYAPCGPNGKPVSINDYCTAYPPGSVLSFFETYADITDAGVVFRTKVSQEIECPAGAYSDPTKVPIIISYNGRTDCICSINSPISCRFQDGPVSLATYTGGAASALTIGVGSPRLVITDPQYDSLAALLRTMAGTNSTQSFVALRGGYCLPQGTPVLNLQVGNASVPFVNVNWTVPLQVNCTGPYVTRAWLNPAVQLNPAVASPWTSDGILPNATALKGLSQLQFLGCPNCLLKGTLPRDWGTQPSLMELRTLDLINNTFTGTLPETWGYLVNLQSLSLSSLSTQTMGRIPAAWGYMRSLRFVNLTGLYVDTSTDSCAPWEWSRKNGLVWNDTLLPPANYQNMSFCVSPI